VPFTDGRASRIFGNTYSHEFSTSGTGYVMDQWNGAWDMVGAAFVPNGDLWVTQSGESETLSGVYGLVFPEATYTPTPIATGSPTATPTPSLTATASMTDTPMPTWTGTTPGLPTLTPTSAPPLTETPTITPKPTVMTPTVVPCAGDCDGDGFVTIDEILTAVNIALGNSQISDCLPSDTNGDGRITVDEILTAVNNALNGCSK
jgi:hypothetical protein